MNPNDLSQNPGEELARNALADVLAKAQSYCTHETERIALQTRLRIAALQAELARLQAEEQRIQGRLHRALPAGDAKERRRKAMYYWIVTTALTVAGFFFSLLAFDPYRLGWKSYLYCAGIALIAPFCVEKFLETWSSPKLIKVLATVACVAALTSLVLLSLVRGDVLTQQFKAAAPAVILSGDAPAPPPQTDFYQKTVCLLQTVMALLALSMEIGAGLALYEARRHSVSAGEDGSHLAQELAAIQQCMVAKLEELRNAENAAAIFLLARLLPCGVRWPLAFRVGESLDGPLLHCAAHRSGRSRSGESRPRHRPRPHEVGGGRRTGPKAGVREEPGGRSRNPGAHAREHPHHHHRHHRSKFW